MRADDFVTGDSARGAGQSSLVGTGTTNAVNTGLVGSATAIAKTPAFLRKFTLIPMSAYSRILFPNIRQIG